MIAQSGLKWQPQLMTRSTRCAVVAAGLVASLSPLAAQVGFRLASADRSAPHRRQRVLRGHAGPLVVFDRHAGRRHHHRQRGSGERPVHPRERREARLPSLRREDSADRPRALRSRRRPRRPEAAHGRAGHGDGCRSGGARIGDRSIRARRTGLEAGRRSIACSRMATRSRSAASRSRRTSRPATRKAARPGRRP